MKKNNHHGLSRPLWVYGYEFAPPVARSRMGGIQDILDGGHSEAEVDGRIWEGRFVNGEFITHVLVVSDSPAQDLGVNQRLKAELVRLEAGFVLTASMEVDDRPLRAAIDPPPHIIPTA